MYSFHCFYIHKEGRVLVKKQKEGSGGKKRQVKSREGQRRGENVKLKNEKKRKYGWKGDVKKSEP